jgi:hypothetical protein
MRILFMQEKIDLLLSLMMVEGFEDRGGVSFVIVVVVSWTLLEVLRWC